MNHYATKPGVYRVIEHIYNNFLLFESSYWEIFFQRRSDFEKNDKYERHQLLAKEQYSVLTDL